jgi:hypothetical protein
VETIHIIAEFDYQRSLNLLDLLKHDTTVGPLRRWLVTPAWALIRYIEKRGLLDD